ncbi:MAG: 3-hydroxyacyl-CoA dehydrogenase [Pseudomonadota bacterium]
MLSVKTVAVIGAGLVGEGWAARFLSAGLNVKLYDVSQAKRHAATTTIKSLLSDLHAHGLSNHPDTVIARLHVVDTLEQAVKQCDYVQESVLEKIGVKTSVCAQISAALPDHSLVGSSSSGIPVSAFTEGLANRQKFFIVHPVNPPHLVPVVEIVPAPWSDLAQIDPIKALLERIGMAPILVEKEIEGFVLNRLQGALLNEAWALYEAGYASAEDIDKTVKHGLGRRWAFMGPFETIALNAPNGIADYAARLSPLYHAVATSRTNPEPWSLETAARLDEELKVNHNSENRAQRLKARDDMLLQIAKLLSG